MPRPFDLVTTTLYLAELLTFFMFGCDCDQPLGTLQPVLLTGCILVLLCIDRVEYWLYGETTPTGAALALLGLRVVLIAGVTYLDHFHFSPFLFLVTPFLAFLYFRNYVGYLLAVLAWIAYFSNICVEQPYWYDNQRIVNNLIIFTVGLMFSLTMGQVVARERKSRGQAERLVAELERSHEQLKAYAAQAEEMATTKERNRLARDIHDSLGHYLTVINVQIEKALTFRERRPEESEQAMRDAKRLASEALQDVRSSVGALRTSVVKPFQIQAAMRELVEQVRDNHLGVELRIAGSEEGFSQTALMTLYRVAQEGFTNMRKHAHASEAALEITFGEDEATLRLSDNGRGLEPDVLHALPVGLPGKYGLQGLQERLELVSGVLRIESGARGGTTLWASVPKKVV